LSQPFAKGPFLKQRFAQRRPVKGLAVTAIVLLIAVGALGKSIKLITSWKNPSYQNQRFHKILVMGVSNNPSVRADFEDALSSKIGHPGVEAVPGHTILLRPEGTKLDLDYVRDQVRSFHIDAVVVSRLVKVDKSVTYVPGQSYYMPYPYYRTFYGYYGTIYPMVYSPGYERKDTTVRIETNLYAATEPDGELIWTGISDSFNPASAHKVIDGLVKMVVKELEKEGILQPAS
jgi:hypothetical protein